jgi:uncharacterized protein (DUF1810 family)
MTLFAELAPEDPVFADELARYFAGEPDMTTLQMLV